MPQRLSTLKILKEQNIVTLMTHTFIIYASITYKNVTKSLQHLEV